MERIVKEIGEEKVKQFFALYDEIHKAINNVMNAIAQEKGSAE